MAAKTKSVKVDLPEGTHLRNEAKPAKITSRQSYSAYCAGGEKGNFVWITHDLQYATFQGQVPEGASLVVDDGEKARWLLVRLNKGVATLIGRAQSSDHALRHAVTLDQG